MDRQLIVLDGTTLEGGGQLLRLSLSISSLLAIPIRVDRIRGKRGPRSAPGKDGGLKAAHLASVRWLALATAARTEGMKLNSTDLTFCPSSFGHTAANLELDLNSTWKDVYNRDSVLRRETHIPMPTPGSIALILQAILPYLIFSGSPVPLRVTIEGGTNVSNSPSIDYVNQVFLPLLHSKLGMSLITVTICKRGWSIGRGSVGHVIFDISPSPQPFILPAFEISHRGAVIAVHMSILAPNVKFRDQIKGEATKQIARILPNVPLNCSLEEDSGDSQRVYLLVVAETESGSRLGSDKLYERKRSKKGRPSKGVQTEFSKEAEWLVTETVGDLEREIQHGGAVDSHMQDQLIIFQALAEGQAKVDNSRLEATLHTQTARWVAERLLKIHFDEDGQCVGVGFGARTEIKARGDVDAEEVHIVDTLERLKVASVDARSC